MQCSTHVSDTTIRACWVGLMHNGSANSVAPSPRSWGGEREQTAGSEQPLTALDQQAELDRPAGRAAFWRALAHFVHRYPLGAAGAAIVLAIALMAIFAGWITAFDPTSTSARDSLARPGGVHLLGADFMGRDMWSRIVFGARMSRQPFWSAALSSPRLSSTFQASPASWSRRSDGAIIRWCKAW